MMKCLPFILVSSQRSGSKMLRTALDAHPHVTCFGELMYSGDKNMSVTQVVEMIESIDGTAGFILHHGQWCHTMDTPQAFIRRWPRLKVIRLFRRNLLAQYVSLLHAKATGQWYSYLRDNQPSSSVVVDVPCMMTYFESQWRMLAQDLHREYNGAIIHVVSYEELVSSYEDSMCRIQLFLGVPYQLTWPTTVKQRSVEVSRCIINYREVYEAIYNSEWRYLLDLNDTCEVAKTAISDGTAGI